jgi:hypothetical protein
MSDFNAKADVYRTVMKAPAGHRFMPPPAPIHSGTIAECISWVMTKHDGYPETYSMRVPLEAGFQTNVLHYRDIEAISKLADFPRA